MRTDELRSLLHDRGDEVHDAGATARIGAVHDRVRTVRRRRAAVAGGGVLAAVAAVALAVVPGIGGTTTSSGPAEGGPGPTSANNYSKDGVTFPAEANGRELLGARVGDPAESEVTFIVPAPDTEPDLQISPVCYGPAADEHAVSVAINGTFMFGMTCAANRPSGPAGEGFSATGEIEEAFAGLGLTPGEPMTVRVWLRERSTENTVVEHRDMVVGAGVYGRRAVESDRVPVAGTELPDRIEHEGRTWALGAVHEGGRGGPMATAFADRTRVPTLIVAVDGGPGGSSYVVRRGTEELRRVENAEAGPSWEAVTAIEPGRGFEITMLVTDGRTKQTEIALVEYYPVE